MYLIINWVLCVVRAAVAKNSTRSVTYIMLVITRGIKFDNVQRRSWRMYQMVKVIMTFILLCLTVRHTRISMHLHRTIGVRKPQNIRQAQPVQYAAGTVVGKFAPIVARTRIRQAQPIDSMRARAITIKMRGNRVTGPLVRVVVFVQELVKLRVGLIWLPSSFPKGRLCVVE